MRCPCKDCKDRAINGHVTCLQAVRGTARMLKNARLYGRRDRTKKTPILNIKENTAISI